MSFPPGSCKHCGSEDHLSRKCPNKGGGGAPAAAASTATKAAEAPAAVKEAPTATSTTAAEPSTAAIAVRESNRHKQEQEDEEAAYLRELEEAERVEEAKREANRGKAKLPKEKKPKEEKQQQQKKNGKKERPERTDKSIYFHHLTEEETSASAEDRTVVFTKCPSYFDDNGIRVACRTIYEQYHRGNQSHEAKCVNRINFRYNIDSVLWAQSLFSASSSSSTALVEGGHHSATNSKKRKKWGNGNSSNDSSSGSLINERVLSALDQAANDSSSSSRAGRIALVKFESKYMAELLLNGVVRLDKSNISNTSNAAENTDADANGGGGTAEEEEDEDDKPMLPPTPSHSGDNLGNAAADTAVNKPFTIVVSAAVYDTDGPDETTTTTTPSAPPQVVEITPCPAGLDIGKLTQIRRRLPNKNTNNQYNKNDYFTHTHGKKQLQMWQQHQQQEGYDEQGGAEGDVDGAFGGGDAVVAATETEHTSVNRKRTREEDGTEEAAEQQQQQTVAAVKPPAPPKGTFPPGSCKHCGNEDHLSRKCPNK